MTLGNETENAARAEIVDRDLSNVLHPILPHRQLERRQLVVAKAENSTIVDADGTETRWMVFGASISVTAAPSWPL
jgi:taurine-pyruvate aminotransferase